MAQSKKTPAEHSQDYRDRQKAKAEKLGIEKIAIDMAAGVKAGMAAAMKRNGITSVQEAWQNIGLYLIRASPEEQDRMLKSDTSGFALFSKLARQFNSASQAKLLSEPMDDDEEVVAPEAPT